MEKKTTPHYQKSCQIQSENDIKQRQNRYR